MNMAAYWDEQGFKKLLKEWNKKLFESGFRDIEDMEHGGYTTERPGSLVRYETMDEISREAKAQYFRRVQQCVSAAFFADGIEREIMNLYAQGVTQTKIKEILKIEGHRSKVYGPIYKWLRLWRLK